MSEERDRKREREDKRDVEEFKEVISVISKEVPAVIKSILASVFSEEAGREMGKAAAAFYKELKQAGMPEEIAVRMTEKYMSTFTSLGDLMKRGFGGEEMGEEISRQIKEKIKEKMAEKHREEEDEDED